MNSNGRTVPCRHCRTGEVSFFAWFRDRHGTIHYASTYGKKVFWACSNPECPGPEGQYNLGLAA